MEHKNVYRQINYPLKEPMNSQFQHQCFIANGFLLTIQLYFKIYLRPEPIRNFDHFNATKSRYEIVISI